MKVCSIDGCSEKFYGKTYCRKHYDKLRNHGDPLSEWDIEDHDNSGLCIFDNCTKNAFSRKYCQTHYARLRYQGKLSVKPQGSCSVADCTNAYYGQNFCKPHYTKWYKHGDPLYIRPKPDIRREIDSNGYIRLYNVEHPNADKVGRILEHRYVLSEQLGRPLLSHENAHHKNGQRNDNRIENLELWSKSQPPGQRVEDKTVWAVEWLKQYAPELLKEI